MERAASRSFPLCRPPMSSCYLHHRAVRLADGTGTDLARPARGPPSSKSCRPCTYLDLPGMHHCIRKHVHMCLAHRRAPCMHPRTDGWSPCVSPHTTLPAWARYYGERPRPEHRWFCLPSCAHWQFCRQARQCVDGPRTKRGDPSRRNA